MKKIILLFFFLIVLAFSVRAVCCDTGCYPDANCCGGTDGRGYAGCKATGNIYYCPQDDAVEGTLLGACLNCLCSDTYTCWWDADAAFCDSGEVCLMVDDNKDGLPETSLCVNANCQKCKDCEGFGCKLEDCHKCNAQQCYWTSTLGYGTCNKCDRNTPKCSDYNKDPNACNGEIDVCDSINCYWANNKCNNCITTTKCEDYDNSNKNTCELDPCGLGDCLWDGKNCFTAEWGKCDNDNKAERGETCDTTDLRGKDCEYFGLVSEDSGLRCTSKCEYDFSGCSDYDPDKPPKRPKDEGKCGDGNFDDGYEACDCGGKVCTNAQLNSKTCLDFGGYVGGVLSCNDDCSFDTRGCSICDQDGARELGESCDCGTGECSNEQLNYKTCKDFKFTGGKLGCSINCEYDFSKCDDYDPTPPIDGGKCGNGILDQGEACDRNNLGGKSCNYFDYFKSGELKCTDKCEFDTLECEIPDPDDSALICELKYEGEQGNCVKTGDKWCWDPYADNGNGECCGDDNNQEDEWIDSKYMGCGPDSSGNYVFQTDPDYSSVLCGLMGVNDPTVSSNAGTCGDIANEKYCWSSNIKPKGTGRCCGNDENERWSYFTSDRLADVLVKETCYDGKWKKGMDLIFYDLQGVFI